MNRRVQYDVNGRRMDYRRLTGLRIRQRQLYRPARVSRTRTMADVRRVQKPVADTVRAESRAPRKSRAASSKRRDGAVARQLVRSARILYALENMKVVYAKRPEQQENTSRRVKRRKIITWQFISRSIAIALTVLALYTVADTLILNQKVKKERSDTVAAAQSDDSNKRQAAEGKDEKDVSDDVIARYKVAPELPRIIHINAIGVKARVLQMGVNADGSMQAPINVFDTGWYTGSVRPGQKGASIIVGHVSGPTRHGIFEKLSQLKNGDSITIENGAGKLFNYQVVASETVKLENVDMNKFMRPANGVDEGLNLMTCAGKWINSGSTMDHRLMVYAKRTS